MIVTMEVPPWLINGNGTPTTGNRPTTIPMLIKTEKKKISVIVEASIREYVPFASKDIAKPLIKIKRKSVIKNNIPKRPNSSPITAKIKSVDCSGRKSN